MHIKHLSSGWSAGLGGIGPGGYIGFGPGPSPGINGPGGPPGPICGGGIIGPTDGLIGSSEGSPEGSLEGSGSPGDTPGLPANIL